MTFSHLHLHTEYSLLNAATRVTDAAAAAKEMEMSSLAITDFGNVFGAIEFFTACEKNGVKPILGSELYLPNYNDHKLKQLKRGQDVYWQIVLLVKNEKGFKNLSQLITKSYLEGFYYKPRIDHNLLAEFSDGLVALSSGFNSEINYYLFQEDRNKAVEAAKRNAKIFPDNYYVELQDNGLPGQQEMNTELISIAKEVGLPVVATNNIHYLKQSDAEAFEVLRGVQLSRTATSPYDHMKYSTDGYYFKSKAEMQAAFSSCPEALSNTEVIAAQCDFNFTYGKYHLPNYETPAGLSLDDYLEQEAQKGLDELWPQIQRVSHVSDDERALYDERLKIEIAVIQKMGFSGYFLIVSDFIIWAKEQGIPVGPGRGSGAGSLVAYCLKITNLDPLPYNLLFERFLNPDRISMPDFDIDFCQDRRSDVIDYVTKKYGNVSQIITFGKMKAKAVIRDVGRVMELEYDYVDKIAKMIPNALNIKLKDALESEADLKKLYKDDETIHRLIDTSLRLEGLSRHASVHAAGVIITDKPLWDFVPLYKGSNDDVVVQFDMKCAEKIGLIKFDFLGLKTLTVIHKAILNVKKSHNKTINIDEIPMTDSLVFKNLGDGDGFGIFQLESSGMQDLMKRLEPNCFEDIIALVALYRPGPLGSGMVDDFIERKKGTRSIEYELPQLEDILKDTYGVIVYQEQVMQIASLLANYSLGEADILRRAMGKKKAEEMDAQRVRFLEGAKENKIPEEKAAKIFDLMAMFAEYGFNKSHSAAYALVSYQTAWLKTHYPTEYMAAIMSTEMEDTDKLLVFMNDCKRHDITMLSPDINKSEHEFSVAGEKKILYSLGALKGVGGAAIESIIEAQKKGVFKSLYDFCSRVDLRRVTKKVIEVLIKAGAFDSFNLSRRGMFEAMEKIVDAAVKKQKDDEMGQSDLFASIDSDSTLPIGVKVEASEDWSQNQILGFEKEVFGFYFSGHPLQLYGNSLTKLTTHDINTLSQAGNATEVTLGGSVTTFRVIVTKKGDKMAFVNFEDLVGTIELIVFPRCYKAYGELLNNDQPLIIKGKVDRSDEGDKIIVESISLLSETLKTTTRSIHLDIPYASISPEKIDKMMGILSRYEGQSHIYCHLTQQSSFEAVIQLPSSLRAMACEPLQHSLNQLFDGNVVRFG